MIVVVKMGREGKGDTYHDYCVDGPSLLKINMFIYIFTFKALKSIKQNEDV